MTFFEGSAEKLRPPTQEEIDRAVAKSPNDVRRVIRGLELSIRRLRIRVIEKQPKQKSCMWCAQPIEGKTYHLDGQVLCRSCYGEYAKALAI